MLQIETAGTVERNEHGVTRPHHGGVLEGHVELVEGEASGRCLKFPSRQIHVGGSVVVEFNPFTVGPHLAVRANGIGKNFREPYGGGRGDGTGLGLSGRFPRSGCP